MGRGCGMLRGIFGCHVLGGIFGWGLTWECVWVELGPGLEAGNGLLGGLECGGCLCARDDASSSSSQDTRRSKSK